MNKGIIYFSAPWCGPCQQLGPKIDELISEGVNVKKVNIDYDTQLVKLYDIKSVPTLILTDLQGNKIKQMQGGGKSLQQLKEWYNG
jgi:thioredoxin 1